MKRYLKEFGEDAIIKGLAKRFSFDHPRVLKAIGDDASVSLQDGDRVLLATTDILIEGTHFMRRYSPARLLGRKSLSISLSDIAAMGGAPLLCLVSIAMPGKTEKGFLDRLYRGIEEVSKEHRVPLAGGNTARTNRIIVSTTVIGEMKRSEVVYRRGARPGDSVYVTGTVGDSALGLKVLKRHGYEAAMKSPFKKAALKHLDPTARLKAGRAIAANGLASAMMDVSDGLLLDLKRLVAESRVSARVNACSLPISAEMREYAERTGRGIDGLTLAGGEDYELLFTSRAPEGRLKALSARLGLGITKIGAITAMGPRPEVGVYDGSGQRMRVRHAGFEHF